MVGVSFNYWIASLKYREHVGISLKGVLPIIPTPFAREGGVDALALGRLVDYAVAGGAGALVFPGVASEDLYLSQTERKAALETVVATTDGRRPVIVGVNADTPETMVALAAEAAAIGADGLMAMAIPAMAPDFAGWFARIADAANGRTIVLQNVFAPRGADLSSAQLQELAEKVPAIRYVKEEGIPSGPKVSDLVHCAGEGFDGVIGGGGARYLLEELDRGVVGTMPAIELLELHVALFDSYRDGDRARAIELFERSLPLLLIQAPYRMRLTKHILKHRGLIDSDAVREKLPEMDEPLKALAIEFFDRAMAMCRTPVDA